ncbi:Pycsar system effector family protein [Mucilaginibacter agri]|uniref:HD domain-containing protein n=1 Tax=Mucilaginibacter agri TaxID=2695265 RepID=A0A965ZDG9_9SPHI|nr:Pycsar system effector family protein [Mucilaginibacter agri]NCD69034.1 HD domain-containing protein [Mucilaginibacter agri]
MNYQKLVDKIARYVAKYFDEHPRPELTYHNFEHTEYVVKAACKIAEHYQLSNEDLFILTAAAWFHDAGYLVQQHEHEHCSTRVAQEYLAKHDVDPAIIDQVSTTIMATCMPQKPTTVLGQILCDADLYHLSKNSFKKKSESLRQELEAVLNRTITQEQWWPDTVSFMEHHTYTSDYGRRVLADKKAENLALLKAEIAANTKIEELHQKHEEELKADGIATEKDQPKKKKKDRPEKGIETMFRITSSNNQRLSDMADKKAHILITVNSIILSAIITLVLRKLDESTFLLVPSSILLLVSLASMTFSILATRPAVPNGTFDQNDLDNHTVNLLFFGNFYRMDLDKYADGMKMVMEDKDFLYGTLVKDVYSQGAVLGRKYHLLRYAYNIFMYGLIVAIVAFIVASVIFQMNGGESYV